MPLVGLRKCLLAIDVTHPIRHDPNNAPIEREVPLEHAVRCDDGRLKDRPSSPAFGRPASRSTSPFARSPRSTATPRLRHAGQSLPFDTPKEMGELADIVLRQSALRVQLDELRFHGTPKSLRTEPGRERDRAVGANVGHRCRNLHNLARHQPAPPNWTEVEKMSVGRRPCSPSECPSREASTRRLSTRRGPVRSRPPGPGARRPRSASSLRSASWSSLPAVPPAELRRDVAQDRLDGMHVVVHTELVRHGQ